MSRTVEAVRKDIPMLKEVIYLDSAATTPTPIPVFKAMNTYFREYCANVGRGAHHLAERATSEYEHARDKVAAFIGAEPEEIIFTRNTTEGINMVAYSLQWERNNKIVTTIIDHHSNLLPWQRLARKKKVELDVVACDDKGMIDPSDIAGAIDEKTKLVATTHVSNVFGSILDVKEIGRIAHEHDALFLVDGAQATGHMPVDVKEINCDFYAFSGHKGLLGPQGTGCLYVKKEVYDDMEPFMLGGGTITSVTAENYELLPPPACYEAGTPNIPGVIGLGVAIDYVSEIGVENIMKHEKKLVKMMLDGFKTIDKVVAYGPTEARERAGVVPWNIKGMGSHEVAIILDDSKNIIVRSGHHCAMPALRFFGLEGTVRASLHYYNTEKEIEILLATCDEIVKRLV